MFSPRLPRQYKEVALAFSLVAALTPVRAQEITLSASGPDSGSGTANRPRIVGGDTATISDYPWQVALIDRYGFQFCGGSIISRRWVVSAAHCYTEALSAIRAGVTDKTNTRGQDRSVARQIQHPAYDDITSNNDIMLIELTSPFDLSGDRAKAIAWMDPGAAAQGLQDPGVDAVITGWGDLAEDGFAPDRLQKAVVPIVSNAEASRAYDPLYGAGSITPQMLAAGYTGGGIDACQGDSGGPLVVPDASTARGFRLAGVTSWGEGCARPGFPGVYTRVSMFADWIGQYVDSPDPAELCAQCLPSSSGWRRAVGP
jgi:secreted trypsin-like serine protease